MPARNRLTVFLLRDVHDYAQALDEGATQSVELRASAGLDGMFVWQSRPASPPPWVPYLKHILTKVPTRLKSSSASGLLLLKAAENYFALTFGYGRSLLDQSKVVRQFGLRVALNTINHDQIRSIDTKTFEDMVVSRNTQSSRSTDLPVFGIDIARDILRAVTGEPRDQQRYGKRVSGADAVVLNIATDAADLPAVCGDLLDAYNDTAYQERFGWVDDLAIVQDKTLIERLDDALADQLDSADTSGTHLAMPDPLDWADIDAFRITGTRDTEYDDLDLDDYLASLNGGAQPITPQLLRSRSVSLRFSRATEFERRWSLYQCLVSEQRVDERLYVLIEGRWFEVSPTLAGRVDAFTATLEHAPITLPPSQRGEHENDYNRRVADSGAGDRLCLDGTILRPEGATSGLEFCDVLLSDGTLLHVKRKSRSSTLSHLFAQGVVSATTLLADGDFRERLRDAIAASAPETTPRWHDLIPGAERAPIRDRFRVSYVVIANSTRPGNNWLPFFSKLNLMQSAATLRNLGIGVTLDRVAIQLNAANGAIGWAVRGPSGSSQGTCSYNFPPAHRRSRCPTRSRLPWCRHHGPSGDALSVPPGENGRRRDLRHEHALR